MYFLTGQPPRRRPAFKKTPTTLCAEAASLFSSPPAQGVIEKDGLLGLFGRGLKTKILSNGLHGLMFSVLWRLGQDWWTAQQAKAEAAAA